MKKFVALALILCMMLMLMPVSVLAAGSASFSGPGTVRAGDTIKLSFTAGGGIYGGSGTVSYDASQVTLQGYSGALGSPWAVEFSGDRFVFYDNSMASPIDGSRTIFTATFTINSSIAPGTSVSISATGVTLSDGVSDSGVGTRTWSATIAEPLSGNANLASLTVSNATISPAFSAGTTSYTAKVPFSTSSLNVSASAEHAGASVSVGSTSLTAGGTTNVSVTVTAENGTTKTYTIRTTRDQDPNYVPSDVNTLETLNVEGFLLSPAFSTDRQAYAVYVPFETETLVLDASVTDKKSRVTLPKNPALAVGENLLEIPVKAENGDIRNYTVTVYRAEPYDKTLVTPTPVPTPVPTPSPSPTPVPTPVPTPTPTPTPSPTPVPYGVAMGRAASQFAWLWILIAVLAFGIGAVCMFFFGAKLLPTSGKRRRKRSDKAE